jgi:hypothetical protein
MGRRGPDAGPAAPSDDVGRWTDREKSLEVHRGTRCAARLNVCLIGVDQGPGHFPIVVGVKVVDETLDTS